MLVAVHFNIVMPSIQFNSYLAPRTCSARLCVALQQY